MAGLRFIVMAAVMVAAGCATGATAPALPASASEQALEALERLYIEPLDIAPEERARLSSLDVPALLEASGVEGVRYITADVIGAVRQPPAPVVLTHEAAEVRVLDVLPTQIAFRRADYVEPALAHGWVVTAIDGEPPAKPISAESIDSRLGGEGGAPTRLSVMTAAGEMREVDLRPERRPVGSVATTRIGDVHYLRVFTFDESTVGLVRGGLLRAEPWLDGVVLDLRANDGGLMDAAVELAGLFLDGGPVVAERRRGEQGPFLQAERGDLARGEPVRVLVDAETAQGATLVAAALQDRRRAIVLGMPTDPTGVIRTIMPLRGGRDGVLVIPTALMVRPSGELIDGGGVLPNVEVSLDQQMPERVQGGETVLTGTMRTAGADVQLSWALRLLEGR